MMKFTLTLFLLLNSLLCANTISIDRETKLKDILSLSEIYIDKTKNMTIAEISSPNINFEKNNQDLLGFGYSPDFTVWIKFTLQNETDKPIQKILEYANPLTTNIELHDPSLSLVHKDGLLDMNKERKSINPIFILTINKHESKTYYLKASSFITTLIIKLKLWDQENFYNKELEHQFYLSLFFGAMAILAIYNLFISVFARDISYLFYVLYILGVIYHQLLYTGVFFIYIESQDFINLVIKLASFAGVLPILFLTLFSKYFLKTEQYPKFHVLLNTLLIVTPIIILVPIFSGYWSGSRNIMSMILILFLLVLTIYATSKKNRQAYFILAGWMIIFTAISLMFLASKGIFNIYGYFPYFIEVAFIAEAVIFSIALSDKINSLQQEKNNVHKELIVQKKTENTRLEIQVKEKTKDLNTSLDEKTLLLQELNHRVKNNMQMIVSLIRLQSNDIKDIKMKNIFLTTENRLNAMSQLHELLYQKDNISHINAYEYFSNLIEGLEETYSDEIDINYIIDTDLQTEQAISAGIILNELVTNSLKHAFENDNGQIDILLSKDRDEYTLVVKDNGIGYDKNLCSKSFGLLLVETLVSSKLAGYITTRINNGVESTIIWREIRE
ncbi:7TM diverse intracellular signaling domain-containing protein [Arcobacteraceae bacterium]|nr:7TM diverse intracellular signaling domain-containing protein [Arcobacteraceae bacterium]